METFTDDTVVALASFLSPCDMLSLALTYKRFGDKRGTDKIRSADRGESTRQVRQKVENVSLMEVAARTVLHAKWTDDEMKALPRHEDESWIGTYHEYLRVFRLPLQFDKLVGECIEYEYNDQGYVDTTDKTKVHVWDRRGKSDIFHSAICSNIMRSGKHSVSFQVNNPSGGGTIALGIMRPTTKHITTLASIHPVRNLSRFSLKKYEILHTDNNVDCCVMNTHSGNILFRNNWTEENSVEMINDWEGKEPTDDASFKIGMALDLDEGTLDVYKNDRHLGTMKTGLVGEYCWVVALSYGLGTKTVSINR